MFLNASRKYKNLLANLMSDHIPLVPNRIALVTRSNVPFGGNLRAVADELLKRGQKQVIVYKDGQVRSESKRILEANGATVLEGFGMNNVRTLLSCETVYISHSARDAHIGKRKKGRKIVNLWHGVPLKRIELLMADQLTKENPNRVRLMKKNAELYDLLVASNPDDADVMARAFGVNLSQVIDCGLPRFDYLDPEYNLPADLARDEISFSREIADRKLVLYAPTFREDTVSPFNLIGAETIKQLEIFCDKHQCVFGLRPHPYDVKSARSLIKKHSIFIDASSDTLPEAAIALRNAHCLITDYSSIWVDYLFSDKPIVGLMLDLEHYRVNERGFIHDFKSIFPGEMLDSWPSVIDHLDRCLSTASTPDARRDSATNKFLPKDLKFNYTSRFLDSISQ